MSILDENNFDKLIKQNKFFFNNENFVKEHNIKITRNDELNIILINEIIEDSDINADSKNFKFLDSMELRDELKRIYELKNIHFFSQSIQSNKFRNKVNIEAYVQSITWSNSDFKKSEYIVEHIDNVPINHLLSDSIQKKTINKSSISIGNIEIKEEQSAYSGGSNGLILNIDNQEIYLIRNEQKSKKVYTDGLILYKGTPNEELRDKFRNVISFFIGRILILLEESFYDIEWNITYLKAFSAKKLMDGRAFKISTILPIEYNYIIDSETFSKHCNSLYQKYDLFDFTHLSWLYWHAQCSALHTKCGEFGATIEALQKSYIKKNIKKWSNSIFLDDDFEEFTKKIIELINKSNITEEYKKILKDKKLGNLNQLPQNETLKKLFEHLNYSINEDELKAWKGRNNSAHGNKDKNYSIEKTIKDINLLQGIFFKLIRLIADIDR